MATKGESPLVLVSGATGYIASHIIKLLLEEGYKVRGTVRSLENEEKNKPLKELKGKGTLELVEADLLNADTWTEAVKGCNYVIHVASPFPNVIPSNPDEVIKPAVEGTLAVLKASSESGTVKRVVLTSSIASIYDACLPIPKENEETKTFSEENWTNTEDPHLDAYAKSKTLAEKAAWDYVKELPDDKKIELAVVNPGVVLGPLVSKHMATSVDLVKKLMDRSAPAVAKLCVCIADVRDVALAHLKAMTVPEATGNRHIICGANVWMKEMAQVLQKEFKPQGYHIPTFIAPNFVVWLNSLVEKSYRLVVPRLSREYKYDNKRMKEVLGITPTEMEKTVIDTANSLIELEILKKPKKSKKSKEAAEPQKAEEATKELEPEDKEKMNGKEPAKTEIEGVAN